MGNPKDSVSWTSKVELDVVGKRMLWLLGTASRRWVPVEWLRPGDRIRITVTKLPKRRENGVS